MILSREAHADDDFEQENSTKKIGGDLQGNGRFQGFVPTTQEI
ncbi:MAG: hypothetical protein QXQ46_08640 [Thermoplasmatales archaeon]